MLWGAAKLGAYVCILLPGVFIPEGSPYALSPPIGVM